MKELKKSVGIVYLVVGTVITLVLAMSLQREVTTTIHIPSKDGGHEVKVGKKLLVNGEMILDNKIILDSYFGDVTISKENKKIILDIPSKTGSTYELENKGNDVSIFIDQTSQGDLFLLTEKGLFYFFY